MFIELDSFCYVSFFVGDGGRNLKWARTVYGLARKRKWVRTVYGLARKRKREVLPSYSKLWFSDA